MTAAAGGVNAGPLRDARTPVANGVPLTDPHTNPGYAARYRAASAQAQAAIVQERVPPALRAYVKAYFVAIRP